MLVARPYALNSRRAATAQIAPRLPESLEASIAAGQILEHGRLQSLSASGAVIPDTAHSLVQQEWRAPLDFALERWTELPEQVPSLNLVSVYARGSIPRGLALPGISDVDTVGFATIANEPECAAALQRWYARSGERTAELVRRFPMASGLEMKLVVAHEGSQLGKWLSAGEHQGSGKESLDEAQLREIDGFRIASQGLLLLGRDLASRLPPPVPRPHLMLNLRTDLRRASLTVQNLLAQRTKSVDGGGGDDAGDDALTIARWAGKRALRSGMELCASTLGAFSRDLLPCHRAIAATLPEPAPTRSLACLQLACLPEAEVSARGGSAVVAMELLHAAELLHDQLETTLLDEHFARPLRSFEQLPEVPPLSAAAAAAAAASPTQQPPVDRGSFFGAAAASAQRNLMTAAARAANIIGRPSSARDREDGDAAEFAELAGLLHADPLPPLTLEFPERPSGPRVLYLDWTTTTTTGRAERGRSNAATVRRLESITRRAVRQGRRPVVLRGAAGELAPLGAPLWSLRSLPDLIPAGRVRVSPDATFIFCKESHELCASGAMPPPSRVVSGMSGEEFVQRITARGAPPPTTTGATSSANLRRPLFYGRNERYYMQADLPEAVLRERQVPELWRSLGVAQAQPLRLWVSTAGATTPLHFDACASFLAQMRGEKRIVFFPPSALNGLYPFPVDHPMHRRSRVPLNGCAEARDETFPQFAEHAEPYAQEVLLREGDCVLFPKHWMHHVETVSPLSCSVGCRYV